MSLARSPVSATVVMLAASPAVAAFDCDLDPATDQGSYRVILGRVAAE